MPPAPQERILREGLMLGFATPSASPLANCHAAFGREKSRVAKSVCGRSVSIVCKGSLAAAPSSTGRQALRYDRGVGMGHLPEPKFLTHRFC